MTQCPRCQGLVHTQVVECPAVTETRCLLCGWYAHPTPPIPIEDNPNRRWESTLCGSPGCPNKARRGKEDCWTCHDNKRGKMGAERHAAKLAAGQAARKLREQEAG